MAIDQRAYQKQWRQKRKREKGGWITRAYGNMTSRNRGKFGEELTFTKDEFAGWLDRYYGGSFCELFKAYVDRGCDKNLVPSIDRIDDYKPYLLSNIRLTTWEINNEKGRRSKKNREQCGEMAKSVWSKMVAQLSLEGEVLKVYPSVRQAERDLRFVDSSTISKVCRGEKRTHKGFKWEYLNVTKEEN